MVGQKVTAIRFLAAPFPRPRARLVVVAREFKGRGVAQGFAVGRAHGVVRGYVRAGAGVAGGGGGVEFLFHGAGFAALEEGGEFAAGVGFAHGFAVPACAFAVGFGVEALVCFGCLLEGMVEVGLGDLVVVVDELISGMRIRVIVIRLGVELVRMPCQIDVQCRYRHVFVAHDIEEALVLDKQPLHGELECGRM